jgi:hypothetical protein
MEKKNVPSPEEYQSAPEMSDASADQSASANRENSEMNGERGYEVGRGKPPRAHQWKPGQSGNPRGREKGSKNESTMLRELLFSKIKIRIGGKLRTVTLLQAILTRFAEDSLKGNVKSAQFLLNRFGALVSGEVGESSISDNDRELLEEFKQKLLSSNTKKEEDER